MLADVKQDGEFSREIVNSQNIHEIEMVCAIKEQTLSSIVGRWNSNWRGEKEKFRNVQSVAWRSSKFALELFASSTRAASLIERLEK